MKLNPHTLLRTTGVTQDTLNLGDIKLIIKEERRKPREQITVLNNTPINNKNELF